MRGKCACQSARLTRLALPAAIPPPSNAKDFAFYILMNLPRGARLGSYEIVDLIGAGGMGEVYRAQDLELGREVAIKILPASVHLDSDRLRRFKQEAQATAALNHESFV